MSKLRILIQKIFEPNLKQHFSNLVFEMVKHHKLNQYLLSSSLSVGDWTTIVAFVVGFNVVKWIRLQL